MEDTHVNWPNCFLIFIFVGDLHTILISCITLLSAFRDMIGISMLIVSFLVTRDYGITHETFSFVL